MKRLYTDIDILEYRSSPIVVRLQQEFEIDIFGPKFPNFLKMLKGFRKLIKGTWGVSQIVMDNTKTGSQYFFFDNEDDLLMFLLKAPNNTKRVYMWPSNLRFTIYEY
jgi:hypothetical protein